MLVTKKENPPRMTSGGNGKPFLWGMPGQGGWADRSRHPNRRFWSYGLRRRIDLSPADRRLEEDPHAWTRESLHRRFIEVWEIGPGAQDSLHRPEHLFIQPVVLGVAFGS